MSRVRFKKGFNKENPFEPLPTICPVCNKRDGNFLFEGDTEKESYLLCKKCSNGITRQHMAYLIRNAGE